MKRFRTAFFLLGASLLIMGTARAQDWTRIGSLPGRITCGYFFDTTSGIVAIDSLTSSPFQAIISSLYKTIDGGGTWTHIILPSNLHGAFNSSYISSIFMHDRMNGWLSFGLTS
jgi:hypothetical protein